MQNCHFLNALKKQIALKSNNDSNHFAYDIKLSTLNNAFASGPPHPKLPTWKYINLQPLLDTAFEINPLDISKEYYELINTQLPDLQDNFLIVFVNGRFNHQLSHIEPSPKITLTSLLEMENYNPHVFRDCIKHSCRSTQFFHQLNGALTSDGTIISISDNSKIAAPIFLYHFIVNACEKPIMINSQIYLTLGENSSAMVVQKTIMLNDLSFLNDQTLIQCNKKSNLCLIRMNGDEKNNYHFSYLNSSQYKGSSLKVIDITLGGNLHRNEAYYELIEPLAKTECYNLILPKAHQHCDCVTKMEHRAPECQSHQLIKSIAENHAHSSFQGIIIVKQEASKTIAKMKNDNLFLGKKGKIDAVPQLEISTDDVQCHHGAMISTIDESSLFYLLARGINKEEATKILIFGFIQEILDKLTPPYIKSSITKDLHQYISSMISASQI